MSLQIMQRLCDCRCVTYIELIIIVSYYFTFLVFVRNKQIKFGRCEDLKQYFPV